MHKKSKKTTRVCWISGLLLAAMFGAAVAAERGNDDPGARQKAVNEWYNGSAARQTKSQVKGRKQELWTFGYERFMLEAAKRERRRHLDSLPRSGTSAAVIDPGFATRAARNASWINIGPTKSNYVKYWDSTQYVSEAGRVNEIVSDPGDPNTLYVAFSGGGVWKSTDGGAFWNAKTETLGSLSVGTIEMDPNNARVLYLGLGDAFEGTGIGLSKSTDAANTWTDPLLLGNATTIQDIQVAPTNSNIVLVATNRGLYRSTNAGASYGKVAIATGQTGDPYLWTFAWGGGTNFTLSLEAADQGQVWRSSDNGASWTRATGVTDSGGVTRISLAAAPSNRNTMYALAANSDGTMANIFKSTDNGATWTGFGKNGSSYKSYANPNAEYSNLGQLFEEQGGYDQAIIVDPNNANVAYFGGALNLAKTIDGGSTYRQLSHWQGLFGLPYLHADFHAAHFASDGTLYLGNDGGIARSTDGGKTWSMTLNEGIASHLIYQLGSSLNNRSAVIVGMQDNGTRVRVGDTGVFNQEVPADGFGCDVNQSNANLMLGSLYYAEFWKSTDGGRNFTKACAGIPECSNRNSAPFLTRLSRWAGDTTGNTLYTYSNTKVYKTTNYASSWTALGRAGLPNATIRGVSAAANNSNVLGVVASDDRVYLTSNGGGSWSAAGTLPGNGGALSWIAFDPTDRNIVYVASVKPDSTKAHLWRSSNFGSTWTAIDSNAAGFPAGIPVNSVVVDPVTRTTLYAATHLGVYRSTNSGGNWTRYGTGMPLVNVTDLYVAADGSLVRAATFGRSVWELVPGSNVAPVANFSAARRDLTVTFTDTSTDSDGTIAARSWSFGDSSTSTAANPSHTYASAGTYSVVLTVTDNGGATNTRTQSVTVTAASSGNQLQNGVTVTGLSGAKDSSQLWTMDVPAGATGLKFATTGGAGDADLYVKFGSAPTTTLSDCKAAGNTSVETCSIATAQAGRYYVLVLGYSAFSGVSLAGSYSATDPNRQIYSNSADYSIPDNNTTGISSAVTVSGRTGNAPANASITVNVVHPYAGDLKLDLIAPDGTTYSLRANTGGSADNIVETYTLNLSAEALNGIWKLRAIDSSAQDIGHINSWSITF